MGGDEICDILCVGSSTSPTATEIKIITLYPQLIMTGYLYNPEKDITLTGKILNNSGE